MSDRARLGAGRKRRSPEDDDQRLKDISDTSGRGQGRVGNMICFNSGARTGNIRTSDVRTLGAIDGHVASLALAPNLKPTRNEGGTVAGEIRHVINPAISFGCDYCATTRRKRDVAGWDETDKADEATM